MCLPIPSDRLFEVLAPVSSVFLELALALAHQVPNGMVIFDLEVGSRLLGLVPDIVADALLVVAGDGRQPSFVQDRSAVFPSEDCNVSY